MMTLRHFTLILFALFLSVDLQAQTGGANPQNSLLPEINPQDIEIRSEFRARFPGLRRQPILGFNPKPRVFRIDPNRMPFMESKEEAVANVAITQLDRPEPPYRETLRTPARTRGYVKAGIGNFITPEAEGYFFTGINERSNVTGNMNYRSSDGHLEDQLSSFRYFDGDVTYNNKLNDELRLSTSVGFLSDFNRLYDLPPTLQVGIDETPLNTYMGFGGNAAIQKTKNALEGWDVVVGGNIFGTELEAGTSGYAGTVDEQVFNAGFSKNWAGNHLYETFNATASVRGGNYEFTGSDAQQWTDTRASLEYRKLINFSTHITAHAGLAYLSDGNSSRVYFTPEVKIRYNLRDAVIISGSVYGKPEMQTVQDHHETNRFLLPQTALQHSFTSGVHGEIALQALEGNRIFGGITYEITKDYAWYDRVIALGNAGYYQVNYGKASVFELFGGITQQLVPEKFWFDARFYARRPKLANDGDIPYEERLGLNGSLSYRPVPKLTVTSWAEYVGSREAPSVGEELKAFALINGGAEYQINNRFGVYVKVLNILGQKYQVWSGYEERPLQAFGGLTFKF